MASMQIGSEHQEQKVAGPAQHQRTHPDATRIHAAL